MLTEEKIALLKERLVKEGSIKTFELTEFGFNSHDIELLIKDVPILKRVKRGLYITHDEIKPEIYDRILSYFINSVKSENYEDAVKWFEKLFKQRLSLDKIRNHYLYLCLLKNLVVLPEILDVYWCMLELNDVSLSKNVEREDIILINKMRHYIFNDKIPHALDILETIKSKGYNYEGLEVLELLLRSVDKETKKIRENIQLALKSRDYDALIQILLSISKRRDLLLTEQMMMHLAKTLKKMDQTLELPKLRDVDRKLEIPDYIFANHFREATLKLQQRIVLSENYTFINILLKQVNEMKVKIDNKKNRQFVESKKEMIESGTHTEVTLDDIHRMMSSKDIVNLNELIALYLKDSTLEEVSIAKDLVLISLITGSEYLDTLRDLSHIKSGNIGKQIPLYLNYLKKSILEYDIVEAELYYNIIKKYYAISGQKFDLIDMRLAIITRKRKLGYGPNYNVYDLVEKILMKSRVTKMEPLFFCSRHKLDTSFPNLKAEVERVKKSKGIAVSGIFDEKTALGICKQLKDENSISSFTIGNSEDRRVVIRYKGKKRDNFNYAQMIKEANKLFFEEKNYEKSLELYLILLSVSNHPKWYNYEMVAKNYLYLGNFPNALYFYRVAQAVYKATGEGKDSCNIIESIEYAMYESRKKKQELEASRHQVLQEIYGLASKIVQGDKELADVITEFKLSDEEIRLLKLALADKLVYNKQYDKALKLVDEVAMLPDNPFYIKRHISRIQEKFMSQKALKRHIIKPISDKPKNEE